MEQSPSWQAHNRSASQDISAFYGIQRRIMTARCPNPQESSQHPNIIFPQDQF
jgi:hypothetical protein